MPDNSTARLGFPLLQPGQAQKEMVHNEALTRLDFLTQSTVEAVDIAAPPAAPVPGSAWIVAAQATDEWKGRDGMIAGWSAGGWRFIDPREGMAVWSIADEGIARFVGGAWRGQTIEAAIGDPAGGGVVDAEARAVLAAVLSVLRKQGLIAA